uniref:Uncharacterized protein n=1 Tax=Panagrellus redivivus TaxID=6233 RepID=A0A7E4VJZ7_PANRE
MGSMLSKGTSANASLDEPWQSGQTTGSRDEGQERTMKGQRYSRNSTSVTPFLNRPTEQSRIDRSDIDPLA